MSATQFALNWQSFKNNLSEGVSYLQQREEFVDMTLAADGHFVKVHQMVLSLASPYLKELITSAPCSHPVLFLNQISYQTLSSILEYVYTGEVLINKENLSDVLQAGRALHIRGLESMQMNTNISQKFVEKATRKNDNNEGMLNLSDVVTQSIRGKTMQSTYEMGQQVHNTPISDTTETSQQYSASDYVEPNIKNIDGPMDVSYVGDHDLDYVIKEPEKQQTTSKHHSTSLLSNPTIQYTLSNQGNIQMILNRNIYYLRYNYKKSTPAIRFWRCVDYIRNKCPASVTTKDDIVVQRVAAHRHPFHDNRIIKKLQTGYVFSTIKDAEDKGNITNNRKEATIIYRSQEPDTV